MSQGREPPRYTARYVSKSLPPLAAGALALLAAAPVSIAAQSRAAPTPSIALGGYFQTQYERIDPRGDRASDRVFFRRMVLEAEAKPFEHWAVSLQLDVAPVASGGRLIVKDAYIRYAGFENNGVTITLGNQKTPFSRSLLQSAARRGIVERPITGDRFFGGPGRAISARADVWTRSETLYIGTAIASAFHAPPSDELQVDGLSEADEDWNQGVLASGRVEWHPLGRMPAEHGLWETDRRTRVMIGAAAYAWRNDGDRNLQPPDASVADADAANGLEVGAGVRTARLTLDGEFQRVTASATVPGFRGGLYANGRASLRKAAVESGWMLRDRQIELLAAADILAADTYAAPWRRAAIGLNWYLHGHRLKFQFMHRVSWSEEGTPGTRAHATHLQAQIAF